MRATIIPTESRPRLHNFAARTGFLGDHRILPIVKRHNQRINIRSCAGRSFSFN